MRGRVRRRIVAEEKDAVGLIEIREENSSDRNANHFGQGDRGRVVTHVGAIGKIVGPIHPTKQLVHIAGLKGSASRRVENDCGGLQLF